MIAPGFGGINLEDIAAPRCFEIEQRLRESLDIPVFHDDQHGTAIVVLAALTNAMRVVEKELAEARVVVAGARRGRHRDRHPAARGGGHRRRRLRPGGLPRARPGRALAGPAQLAEATNPRRVTGDLHAALPDGGADVFIGVSAPGILDARVDPRHGRPRRRLRPGQPRPRGRPGRGRQARRRRGLRAAPTTPTRSTTCWPSPASSAACSTRGPPRSPSTCCCAPPQAIALRRARRRAQPELHHPQRLRPQVPKAVAAAIRG